MNQTLRETLRVWALEQHAAAIRCDEVRLQRPSRRQLLRAAGLTAGAVSAVARARGGSGTAQGRGPEPDAGRGVGRPRGPVGRPRAVESLRRRLQSPERARPPLRAAGVLQRVRRQAVPLAGLELPVQPRRPGADDQDPARHQVERRRAVQRGRRGLHPEQPPRPGPQGEVGRGRPAVRSGGPGGGRQHGRGPVQGAGSPLLPLPDLQVRHRRLHRAQAHLPGPGLDHVQAFRSGQGLAGHHRSLEGGLRLAPAEGARSTG